MEDFYERFIARKVSVTIGCDTLSTAVYYRREFLDSGTSLFNSSSSSSSLRYSPYTEAHHLSQDYDERSVSYQRRITSFGSQNVNHSIRSIDCRRCACSVRHVLPSIINWTFDELTCHRRRLCGLIIRRGAVDKHRCRSTCSSLNGAL